jgi:SH3-like domain-containing protein
MGNFLPHILALALMVAPAAAWCVDFRSVGDAAAILYDAPSAKANKLFIVNRGYPVEVVVLVEGWTKVRDPSGAFSWIESRRLNEKRMVLVSVPLAQVRQSAAEDAPLVFQARQNVLLELVGAAGGWLHVKHEDGQAGFVKAAQVWGA